MAKEFEVNAMTIIAARPACAARASGVPRDLNRIQAEARRKKKAAMPTIPLSESVIAY